MSTKRISLALAADAVVAGGQSNYFIDTSWSDPEEGRRMISAFLRIKEARLREAFVTLVEELSTAKHTVTSMLQRRDGERRRYGRRDDERRH